MTAALMTEPKFAAAVVSFVMSGAAEVDAGLANDRCNLQFVIQGLRVARPAQRAVVPDDGERIGVVKGRMLVPTGGHLPATVLAGLADMLFKGIGIA